MGTIPDMISVMKSESAAETVVVPGGLSIAYLEEGEWKVKDVLMHDGSKLSQVIVIIIVILLCNTIYGKSSYFCELKAMKKSKY